MFRFDKKYVIVKNVVIFQINTFLANGFVKILEPWVWLFQM